MPVSSAPIPFKHPTKEISRVQGLVLKIFNAKRTASGGVGLRSIFFTVRPRKTRRRGVMDLPRLTHSPRREAMAVVMCAALAATNYNTGKFSYRQKKMVEESGLGEKRIARAMATLKEKKVITEICRPRIQTADGTIWRAAINKIAPQFFRAVGIWERWRKDLLRLQEYKMDKWLASCRARRVEERRGAERELVLAQMKKENPVAHRLFRTGMAK